MRFFQVLNALKGVMMFAEGDPSYSLNLSAAEVTNGFFKVISDNILAVLTLMGIMLGVGWILKRFRKARKGSV